MVKWRSAIQQSLDFYLGDVIYRYFTSCLRCVEVQLINLALNASIGLRL